MSRLRVKSPFRLSLSASNTLSVVVVIFVLTHSDHFANHGGSATAQEFVYPGQAKSERDLSTCAPYEICSVVHKRYWYSIKVERLCRCDVDGQECSSSWSDHKNDNDGDGNDQPDKYTMALNNRAQIKFCEPITALPNCLQSADDENSINTTTASVPVERFLHVINETRTETLLAAADNVTTKHYKLTSKAECYCPPHNTWIAHTHRKNQTSAAVSYSSTSYRCSRLLKCKPGDTCGFERVDLYSNYYKCSCPYGYLCLRSNQSADIRPVNEMLYQGPAFLTYCQRRDY